MMLNPYPSQKNTKMMRGNNLFDERMRMLDVLLINGFLSEKLCTLFAVIFIITKSTKKIRKEHKGKIELADGSGTIFLFIALL
jgi:hypothetical protein